MQRIFEDFVGIYENVLINKECEDIIHYYENMSSMNLSVDYKKYSNGNSLDRKDETVFCFEPDTFFLNSTHAMIQKFVEKFWPCYKDYAEEYQSVKIASKHMMQYLRVQKTLPGQGFHNWHFENGDLASSSRLITFMIYLNDVDTGGETEFLYYHKRIVPKAGRLLIWPSGFPHTHRGNPPLTGAKYIITGWLNLVE